MNSMFVATSPEGGGRAWTLTSRLGDMLCLAERLYGPRDTSWTILGIEFGERNPHTHYPNFETGRKDILIRLSPNAMKSENVAVWQLAHEVVHLLAPADDDAPCLVIEEGAADYFQADYMQREKREIPEPTESTAVHKAYESALSATRSLMNIDSSAIKRLRSVEPCFSRFTADIFKDAGLDVPRDLIDALLAPFDRQGDPAKR